MACPLLLLSAFTLHFSYNSSPAEAAPASLQDGGALAPATSGDKERSKSRARRKRVKEKYRAMLERNPYHDLALTKVLQFAAEENTIDALVEEFQSLVRENASEPGYRFILARLYQRGDRLVEAVSELEQIAETNDHLLGLLGEIYTQQGEFLRAAETLEKAAEQAKDEKSLRKLYRAIGDLHLAQGKKEKAAAAYRKIIEIDPESFYLRQGVAETLAEGGLLEEALGDWRALLDLARDDSSKRCAVLREMGRIHERRKDFDEALSHYTRAAQLLRRGNWMKADIESRIVRVHRERGTLDALEEEVRKRIEANPQEIDPHIFLAMVLEEKGEVDRAAEAIGAATRSFPDDLDLGKRRIALLRDIGDSETQVQEYQRLIARHPEEVDLYIELGRIFAREEKFSQAKLQWESLLAEEVRDSNLCLRLADLYARFDLVEDAIRSHELAIQIAPKEKSHRVALGSYLYSLGRKEEALARWSEIKTLGQAAEMTLAEILLGHGFDEEALEIADEIRERGFRE
ncbi:MAG: tetratricopeptide repeat protein, partial [Planctomycetota bacterium]|nr:tetratricopeptide repeat protein [Planctomycetota bacterium]